jgi:hypothetical protein
VGQYSAASRSGISGHGHIILDQLDELTALDFGKLPLSVPLWQVSKPL